ncbi:thermonuclease family protein [Mycoplasmopsis iners]|uniref:thermonuclease family protein n=1 Tax=Mycoplasmopsis iners TaxID=76630 RepID=UPI0004973899|nr:thermonuclease family protein [Mycoplasmopsis iners]
MKNKWLISLITMFSWFLTSCSAREFIPLENIANVKAHSVYDGDTFKVKLASQIYSIRLFGVDCPEMNRQNFYAQKWANLAKQFTAKWLEEKAFKITYFTDDVYQRKVCCVCDNDNNELAYELVKNGYAIVSYVELNKANDMFYVANENLKDLYYKLKKIEGYAFKNKLGLWSDYQHIQEIYEADKVNNLSIWMD